MPLLNFPFTDYPILFDPHECAENVHFCNKLWQASKFSIGWATKFNTEAKLQVEPTDLWQKWLLHRLFVTVERVNAAFESMHFSNAVDLLKQFLINDFCDTFVVSHQPFNCTFDALIFIFFL